MSLLAILLADRGDDNGSLEDLNRAAEFVQTSLALENCPDASDRIERLTILSRVLLFRCKLTGSINDLNLQLTPARKF